MWTLCVITVRMMLLCVRKGCVCLTEQSRNAGRVCGVIRAAEHAAINALNLRSIWSTHSIKHTRSTHSIWSILRRIKLHSTRSSEDLICTTIPRAARHGAHWLRESGREFSLVPSQPAAANRYGRLCRQPITDAVERASHQWQKEASRWFPQLPPHHRYTLALTWGF